MRYFLGHIDSEYSMGPTGQLIHPLIASLPILQSRIDQIHPLPIITNGHNNQILHIRLPNLNILPNLQLLIIGVKQIINILHIDLHKRQTNRPLTLLPTPRQRLNDIVEG